jgi:hypothetical protein
VSHFSGACIFFSPRERSTGHHRAGLKDADTLEVPGGEAARIAEDIDKERHRFSFVSKAALPRPRKFFSVKFFKAFS